mmetsp:Transcript_7168/g.30524  ORF Transcript_7168/g.30524 Transcript_7168/m.30524 type:complete len:276 (-) Transcript_7168:730-1557(-)
MSVVLTNMPPARRMNAWWPCIRPSATNTSPFSGICTAPMSTGIFAISCTFCSGVKNCSAGSAAACRHPRKHPSRKPQMSRRSATFLASHSPPSDLFAAFSLCGIRMDASVLSASTAMRPSWNICAETVCAAAEVPVESMVRIARMTAMNVMFCAIDRSCTAAPPTMSLPMFAHEGTQNRDFRVMMFRLSIVLRYKPAAVTSDALVAIAAPATPMALSVPAPKIRMGSRTRLMHWLTSVIFMGVVTSSVPRNAAKPTVEMIAGMNVSARQPMYGPA